MGQGGSGAQDKELPAESHQKLPNRYVRQESGEWGGHEDDKHRFPPAQPCLEPTVRGKVGSRCLLGRGLLSGVGRCKDEVIQAPHASPRGLLHVGFWRGSEADPWCLSPGEDGTQWAAGGHRQPGPPQQHWCPWGWQMSGTPGFRVRVSAPNTAEVCSLSWGQQVS